jgi:hypothetical protein
MARQVAPTFGVAAAATLVVAVGRPPSIIVVGTIAAILAVTWFRLFLVYLAAGGDPQRETENAG